MSKFMEILKKTSITMLILVVFTFAFALTVALPLIFLGPVFGELLALLIGLLLALFGMIFVGFYMDMIH